MGAWEHGMAWARESTKEVWFVLGTSWRERRERGLSDSDLAKRPTDGTLSSTAHSSQRGLTWLAQAQAQAQALARADRGRYVSGTMRRPRPVELTGIWAWQAWRDRSLVQPVERTTLNGQA